MMLRTIKTLTLVTVTTLSVIAMTTQAKAETLFGDYLAAHNVNVEISTAIDFYNKYVWRGFLLDDDAVIQPSVTLAIGGFEGGFWGSWDVENDDMLKSDEVDGWIGYGFDLGFLNEDMGIVGVNFGHTWYSFPEASTGLADGAHTEEFYAGITLDTLLSPYFTWYGDYGDEASGGADGDYFMVGISHSFTLNEDYGISLDLGYEFNYNSEAFIADDGGYNLISAGLTLPLTEMVTIAPVVAYSMPYGDIDDANDDEVYVGVSTGFEI